jgi:stage II sporulation protein AA (anti-sigma F factor antagonist)
MLITHNCAGGEMKISLSGEIDHHNAARIRESVDFLMEERMVDHLVMDFSKVTFMDSSGLALILGRYRKMRETGGSVEIVGVSPIVRRMLTLSGVDKLIEIK